MYRALCSFDRDQVAAAGVVVSATHAAALIGPRKLFMSRYSIVRCEFLFRHVFFFGVLRYIVSSVPVSMGSVSTFSCHCYCLWGG
ncbi:MULTISPECIES: hypothetical protein [Candidatus Ichthyocystis]|uniref:hypothetical protein n=1 Tax=Candidatus Ichthyocystis TaxID=2929841 RepID=UPI001111D321|nr:MULTISPECIES: hypothetical protein [Ichthyocystis]